MNMKNPGAIFPISSEYVARLLDEGKDVFVKFTKLKKFGADTKVIFYVSGEKLLAGEGTIINVENLDPKIAWMRYGKRIFLTKEEYDNYVMRSPISGAERKMEKITVFTLKDLKRYKKPIKYVYHMTPAGRYLTK